MFAEIDSDISADTREKKHSIWKYRSIGDVAPMFLEIKIKKSSNVSNLYFRPTVERGMVKAIVQMLEVKNLLSNRR